MKKILVALLLVSSALSFAAGRVLRDVQAENRGGIIYIREKPNLLLVH